MNERDERLAELVAKRMDDLSLSPTAFSERTGVTMQGLAALRRGEVKRYQKRLTLPVCELFGWSPDSIDRILAGGEPEPVSSPIDGDDVRDRVARLERLVLRLALVLEEVLESDEDLEELGRSAAQ